MLKELPLEKAFLLVEPGPVVMVTTAYQGNINLMTMSWLMVAEFSPRFACVNGPWNHSFRALRATGECVIAIPAVDLLDTVIEVGNYSGRDLDKFGTFGLTPLPADFVEAPLVKECLANIECRIIDYLEKYNIFILDGVKAWIDPGRKERRTFHAIGDGSFVADGEIIDRRQKMQKIPPGV